MSTAHLRRTVQVPRELHAELSDLCRRIREWALQHPEQAPDHLAGDTCSIAQAIEHLLRFWERKHERTRKHQARKAARKLRLLKPIPSEGNGTEEV